jgi:energy-converting hydrogenase A subunit R
VNRVFVSDCEGPISKNDHAFEVASKFVPNGDKLFTVISRYDDILAELFRRPSYNAGDTLKLILPFLKAYEVTDEKMREFAAKHLVLVPDVKETLQHVRKLSQAFIISTSYEHYIMALCQSIEFPFENTYCTRVNLDKYSLGKNEKIRLKQLAQEIAEMAVPEISLGAASSKDLDEQTRTIIHRLDEIFFDEIATMESGRIYVETRPVGGSGKAEAIKDIVRKQRAMLSDLVYFGDSITDEEAFKLVRENGGLTVSFNGNQHAVESAEIAVLSQRSIVTAVLAEAFIKSGRSGTLALVQNWNQEGLEKSQVSQPLVERLFDLDADELPKVKIITRENMKVLAEESTQFRKRVRGEAIGGLG